MNLGKTRIRLFEDAMTPICDGLVRNYGLLSASRMVWIATFCFGLARR